MFLKVSGDLGFGVDDPYNRYKYTSTKQGPAMLSFLHSIPFAAGHALKMEEKDGPFRSFMCFQSIHIEITR